MLHITSPQHQKSNLSFSDGYDSFHIKDDNTMSTPLSLCREGDKVIIKKIKGHGGFKKRLLDMGFRKGKELTVVRYAPLRDPMEVELTDSHISLRVEEAEQIEVSHHIKHHDK